MLISLVIAGAPAESASPGTRHPGKHKSCNDDAVQQQRAFKRWKQLKAMEKMDALLDMRGSWAGLLKQLQLR